jgi:hypothetical protein
MWPECLLLKRLRIRKKEFTMSSLGELFGGGKNPANSANNYLNQIPGSVSPYYQPYINQGQQSNQILQGQYGNLINNPNAIYDKLGQGYHESPGYQFKLNQALQAGTNAAAAGGMAGSPQHEQQNMQVANDIAGQDYQDYINHILGLYGIGLQGEQGLGQQGFQASTGYGDILGSNLAQQGGLAYQGQAGQNANRSNLWGNLISGAATIGGTVLGGPIGGAVGNAAGGFISNKFTNNNSWNDPGSLPGWR